MRLRLSIIQTALSSVISTLSIDLLLQKKNFRKKIIQKASNLIPLRKRTLMVAFGKIIGPNDRGDSRKSMLLRRPDNSNRDGDWTWMETMKKNCFVILSTLTNMNQTHHIIFVEL